MDIFVTGANGFIGRRLCQRLCEKSHGVYAVAKGIKESDFSKSKEQAIEAIEANVLDPDSLKKAIAGKNIDCCIHLAGFSNNPANPAEEKICFSTNVDGTKNVLEALGTGGKCRAFVFMSSVKVYGNAKGHVDESSPLLAEDIYSKSKICAEKEVEHAVKKYGFSAIILRPSNSYGPGDLSLQRIIPGSLKKIFSGGRPAVYGDGSAVKNFLFVDDTIEAIILAAEKAAKGTGIETINIAGEKNISIRELEEIILGECCSSLEPEFIRGKIGESAPEISTARAKKSLGWGAKTGIEKGIRVTVKWYRDYFMNEPGKITKD